jgi:tellurium resistance protein TerD
MAVMKRGANVALTREVPGLSGLVLGVGWNAGHETALADNLVTATLLCDVNNRALSEQHFVFFNQLTSPDLSVRELEQAVGEDQDQIEIDLNAVPANVDRIVIVLYVNDGPAQRRTLGQLKSCYVRVLNLAGNAELVRSEDFAPALSQETALALGEVYRHDGGWKFKVLGQGYSSGVAGILSDYGLSA